MTTRSFGIGTRVSGIIAALAMAEACGQAERDVEVLETQEQALCIDLSCAPVEVAARRFTTPASQVDGTAAFAPPRSFFLPPLIPVTIGNAGNKRARITLERPLLGTVTCSYKGIASKAHPTAPYDIAIGRFYVWESCSSFLLPGQKFAANSIKLEVLGADPALPVTEAKLVLLPSSCPALDAGVGAVDAGRDAALLDSGPDANTVDAGFEAGVLDAGLPDSGGNDVGRDAGVLDAGRDAGVIEAGPSCTAASCSDSNLCNGIEVCNANGTCSPGVPVNPADGNLCTLDSCDPVLGAVHTPGPVGADCSDGNACNGAEACNAAGTCAPGAAPVVDDGNVCTADACDPALGVTHAPVAAGVSCADGNVCNGSETCNGAGVCAPGTTLPVDDGNPCTTDSCDAALGVLHTPAPAGTSCADANVCNGTEVCSASGTCTPGTAPNLDDGNVCTIDGCDPVTGVYHAPNSTLTQCSFSPPPNRIVDPTLPSDIATDGAALFAAQGGVTSALVPQRAVIVRGRVFQTLAGQQTDLANAVRVYPYEDGRSATG
jgi:hypothetical protein